MTLLESIGVDAFGFTIVFAVLIALSLIIKLISAVIGKLEKKASATEQSKVASTDVPLYGRTALSADEGLTLFDVDEKTAALIMAIVSDESKIPLQQLQFKSIRLINQEVF